MPQLVDARPRSQARPLLAVVPLRARSRASASTIPFGDAPWALGEIARRRGAEVPGRLVASSKSWLVARRRSIARRAILPWGARRTTSPQLSPVDAARAPPRARAPRVGRTRIPDAPLAEQDVVLTVPASFDEVARELTLEAATRAGLVAEARSRSRRPRSTTGWRAPARAGSRALLGGDGRRGARARRRRRRRHDRPVARPRRRGAEPRSTRVAVGPAPAARRRQHGPRARAPRASRGSSATAASSTPARFAQLVARVPRREGARSSATRRPSDAPVTVLGARRAARRRRAHDAPRRATRSSASCSTASSRVVARDARARSARAARSSPSACPTSATSRSRATSRVPRAPRCPRGARPTRVLLNGGVFRAARIAERARRRRSSAWRGGAASTLLPDADPGSRRRARRRRLRARARGRGVRIGGGAARGYYVGVGGERRARARAVCVVPRGAEEGVAHVGARPHLRARRSGGRCASTCSPATRPTRAPGDVVDVDDERFARLPPARDDVRRREPAAARGRASRSRASSRPSARSTSRASRSDAARRRAPLPPRVPAPRRRRASRRSPSRAPVPVAAAPPRRARRGARAARPRLRQAARRRRRPRGEGPAPRARARPRRARPWTTEIAARSSTRSCPSARARRRSADHERVFWLLAGCCIRPASAIRSTRGASPRSRRSSPSGSRSPTRRAAGSSSGSPGAAPPAASTRRRRRRSATSSIRYLAPAEAGLKKPKKPALGARRRARHGVVARARAPPPPRGARRLDPRAHLDRSRSAPLGGLGRLGARVPAYASVHHVVAPRRRAVDRSPAPREVGGRAHRDPAAVRSRG